MQDTILRKVTRIGVYAAQLHEKRLLLITKKGGCYKGLLDLPGGSIEFGETIEEALRREFREEVAMTFSSMRFFNNFTFTQDYPELENPFSLHHIGLIYEVEGIQEIPNAKAEEEHDWYPIETLKQSKLTPFARNVFQRAKEAL